MDEYIYETTTLSKMTTIESISIISPFVSAVLTAFLTFKFAVQSKRFDILYENKMPAFKEVASKIVSFKNFCNGRVAYFEGNEYAPFYEEGAGTLNHRIEIAKSLELNSVFLSETSRSLISDLLNQMSGLCNAENEIASESNKLNSKDEYLRIATLSESLVDVLYKELNLYNR